MYCSKKNTWAAVVAIIAILISNVSFAVGLGKIKVYSYLNELLSAEIELIGVEDLNTELLIANLANSKDFVRANMARPFFLTKLSFEVVRYDEQTVIYVSSTKPVKHPFLDFLVELSWPDGKLVKGYTILIDPPPKDKKLSERERPKSLFKRKSLLKDDSKFDEPESVVVPKNTSRYKEKPLFSKGTITVDNKPVELSNKKEEQEKEVSLSTQMSTPELLIPVEKADITSVEAQPSIMEPHPVTVVKSEQPITEKSTDKTGNKELQVVSISNNNIKPNNSGDVDKTILKKEEYISPPPVKNIQVRRSDENLITDDTDVENAFTDNIEVNKQKRSTGLLQSIVSAVKENPLFERSTIDSSKLAEKPLASVNTEQKLNNKATLEDLLNQDDKQNQQNKNASNNNSAQIDDMDKNLSAHKNNKIMRTETKITDSKLDQQDSNLLIEEQKRQNNKALYKKYGLQLVLSFLMVLISGVFVLKLLRRSNSSIMTEEFQESLTIANNKITNENLTEKSIDSIHHDYVSGTKLSSSGATDFSNIDDDLASLNFDEHSDTNVDELAEIEAAISDIKKEEGIQDYKPSKPAISKKIMDIPTKSSHMPIENTDFDIETIELSEHMTNETLTLNGGNMEELLPDELQESFDLLADNKKEVNLKIDLAKQYVEAGDATSAKSILNEIIDIAEPEQKHEIEIILKELVSSKA